MTEDELWAAYKLTSDRGARDELIMLYTPLVRYVASRVSAGLPHSIDQSDLTSYGMFGLIDAITKFDVSRSTKFETYAIARIRGSIFDELRSIDWVPRSVRSKARAVEQAYGLLESSVGRHPTDDEVAAYLQVSEAELQRILGQISYVAIAALDEGVTRDDKEVGTLGDTIADRDTGPLTAFEVEEMKRVLVDTITRLTEREKVVLTLYYYENLTLAQVGEVLGVTESRVCQIHTKAVTRLGVACFTSSA